MEDPPAARGAQLQGADIIHSAIWGNPRGGGRVRGRLQSKVKVTMGGDKPHKLGSDDVTLEDMREGFVASSEYEQQMHITNEVGRDRVLARRRDRRSK